ncbi:50S ribosomal protein L35 [Enterobacteriaceae endosymbiont of Neohaemonia nigricornis]|uniref:50S ribosomal protein L35 n=1 Tax=Enterobacteriaceae endosymbiont of Neohaemonia nigricornis TaxID=2675792 RepID=UPI001449EBF3|nr:50S ribosomal protein L35 [Enterobacteriaceae endosymbiont of Neohaemonia nigricornis]QJC30307.1 50S ribosomal protein L35 [Enterobacteriaceae endosymbiont of Neohaemonia nigricornis]
MLKMKTVRSFSKRFKKTGTGRYKHKQANLRHLLTKKTSKNKRSLRHKKIVNKGDTYSLKTCLPYL